MHNSLGKRDTLNRRRFLSLSGQSLAVMGLAQLIPVNLLAEEKLPDLPEGLLRMGRDIFPHDFISDRHYIEPLLGLVDEQPDLVASGLSQLQTRASQAHEARF